MTRRAPLPLVLLAAAACAYGADRLTKFLAERYLANSPPLVLIPHVVQLNYTLNPGGAFGLGGGQPWIFFGATVAVSIAILAAAPRLTTLPSAIGLGLILGGALGNLTDRLVHGTGVSGKVVDFVDFHVWPVFNLADSSIVIGAAIILLATARKRV